MPPKQKQQTRHQKRNEAEFKRRKSERQNNAGKQGQNQHQRPARKQCFQGVFLQKVQGWRVSAINVFRGFQCNLQEMNPA